MRQEDFRTMARQSGLPFTDEQLDLLFEGYGKLERMLDAIGSPSDPATPPAVVFVPAALP